jgi:hypothetical protein
VTAFQRPQRSRRIFDYRALNDGSDEEAAPEDRIIEEPPSKRVRNGNRVECVFLNLCAW